MVHKTDAFDHSAIMKKFHKKLNRHIVTKAHKK